MLFQWYPKVVGLFLPNFYLVLVLNIKFYVTTIPARTTPDFLMFHTSSEQKKFLDEL
jgi:hypothetical protein